MTKHDYEFGVSSSPVTASTEDTVRLSDHDSKNPQQTDQSTETRAALRRRVLKTGNIRFDKNFADIPCRIKNISETGVLIEVADKYMVPDNFNLEIPMSGFSVQCDVVRRMDKQIALVFVGEKQQVAIDKSQSIRSSTDPYLDSLIRKDRYVVDNPSDTELAVRRHQNQPAPSRNGFGRR